MYQIIVSCSLWSRFPFQKASEANAREDESERQSPEGKGKKSYSFFPCPSPTTTGFPTKWRLRNKRRNSILITHHYPDLGSASDWSRRMGNLIQPIRSTTQVWVVTSSVWNFCAHFSDAIWQGNQWWLCQMLAVFSGYPSPSHLFLCTSGMWLLMISTKQIVCQQATSIAVLIQLNVVIGKVCPFALNLNILLIPLKNIALQICQELRDWGTGSAIWNCCMFSFIIFCSVN